MGVFRANFDLRLPPPSGPGFYPQRVLKAAVTTCFPAESARSKRGFGVGRPMVRRRRKLSRFVTDSLTCGCGVSVTSRRGGRHNGGEPVLAPPNHDRPMALLTLELFLRSEGW